jgi:TetR/AcrR family transcriptional regulator
VFAAAADAFSRHGYEGVTVDEIARAARVNKAMIYYHFQDKRALYREIFCEMLRDAAARVSAISAADAAPEEKIAAFVSIFVALGETRPYFPPLMLREMSEGAPRLDAEALGLMRAVFSGFGRILDEGQRLGVFRPVHPVLAYLTTIGPLMLNAARERAGAQPGRDQLPMFAPVPRADLSHHLQRVARQMLRKD